MKNKLLEFISLTIGLSITAHAADVKVTPMTQDEAAYFLKSIQKISYSYDASDNPVITFYDADNASIKQHTATSPAKITFESEEKDAIDDVKSAGTLSFYPNPSTDVLCIKGLDNPTQADIYDMSGQCIISKQTSGLIDVSRLPAGNYVLYIEKQVFKVLIR